MLPDIEEMETTPKLGRSRRSSPGNQSPRPFAPSFSNMDDDAKGSVDRNSKRFSVSSSSGASEDFDFGQWDRFDGAASVDGESMFQDEEEDDNGVANLDRDYRSADQDNGEMAEVAAMIQRREEALSSAALSKRAERILANAKKRLTVSPRLRSDPESCTHMLVLQSMEGNLSRARHSLMVSPSLSSSDSIDTAREIPQHLSGVTEWTMSPPKHRQLPSALSSSSGTAGHSRVFSETSVPSSLQTTPQSLRLESEEQRASSAMGSVGMTPRLRNQHDPKPLVAPERSRDDLLSRSTSLSSRHQNTLQPLNEEESASVSFPPSGTIPASPEQDSSQQAPILSAIETKFPTNTTLTRSRSSMQMRDLREQMQDLKGKISTLKERARRDNLRRRSLQSLRTPSPFTEADQWYTGREIYRGGHRTTDAGFVPNELPSPLESDEEKNPGFADGSSHSGGQHETEDAHSVVQSHYENALEQAGDEGDGIWIDEDAPRAHMSNGYHHRNSAVGDEVDKDSMFGDQDFYESSPSPMGERHEDRPDAFDYEHFFLRSDLGTYGRTDHRRRNSYDSTDSVETTKGPTVLDDPPSEQVTPVRSYEARQKLAMDAGRPKGHHRNHSVDSISSFATFATATEGRGSDAGSDADEEEWEQHQRQYPMAGTWDQDYLGHQSSGTPTGSWASRSHTAAGPDSAIRVHGHLTPGPPTGSSTPSPPRSFPLVNGRKHLTPSPSPQPLAALVSALLAQTRPDKGTSTPAMQLSKEDGDLVERLLESLGKVCVQLRGDGDGASKYEGRVWRRRMDAARRVLDGEVDEDALR